MRVDLLVPQCTSIPRCIIGSRYTFNSNIKHDMEMHSSATYTYMYKGIENKITMNIFLEQITEFAIV